MSFDTDLDPHTQASPTPETGELAHAAETSADALPLDASKPVTTTAQTVTPQLPTTTPTDTVRLKHPKTRWLKAAGLMGVLLLALAGAGWWAWVTLLPKAIDSVLQGVQKQLAQTVDLDMHYGGVSLGLTPQGQVGVTLSEVTWQHPIADGQAKQVVLQLPVLTLLQNKPHVDTLAVVAGQAKLNPQWQQYRLPAADPKAHNPLLGTVVALQEGYFLTIDSERQLRGPGAVLQGIGTDNGQLELAGLYQQPGWVLPVKLVAKLTSQALVGWQLTTKPMLHMPSLSATQAKTLQQLGLTAKTVLPVLLAEGTPTAFKVQTQPGNAPVYLALPNGVKLGLNTFKAVGRWDAPHNRLIAEALLLQGKMGVKQRGAIIPMQPVTLMGQGVVVAANKQQPLLDFKFSTPKPLPLKGQTTAYGPWQATGKITSRVTGPLNRLVGLHHVTLQRVVSRFGQQYGQVIVKTLGEQWRGALVQQLDGNLLQGRLRVKGEVTPVGFRGVAQVQQLPLTAQVMGLLGPQAQALRQVRAHTADVVVQQWVWARPLTGGVAQVTAHHVTTAEGILLPHPTVLYRQGQWVLPATTAWVAGTPVQVNGWFASNQVHGQVLLNQPVQLAKLKAQLPRYMRQLPPGVTGQVTGRLQINGALAAPAIVGNLGFAQLTGQWEGYTLQQANGTVAIKNNQWQLALNEGGIITPGNNTALTSVAGVLQGHGAHVLKGTISSVTPLNLATLNIPGLTHGQANVVVNRMPNPMAGWSVQTQLQQATAGFGEHTMVVDGTLTTQLPDNNLTGLHVVTPRLDVTIDGVPLALAAKGYPLNEAKGMQLTTALPLDTVWTLPAMQGIAGELPPYQHLLSQWHITPQHMVLKALQAEGPRQAEWPAAFSFTPHVSATITPNDPQHWVHGVLNFTNPVNLAPWAQALNSDYFAGMAGQLQGKVALDLGALSQVQGQLTATEFTLPGLKLQPTTAQLDLTGRQGQLTLNKVTIPGVKQANFKAQLPHWNDWPLQFSEATIEGQQFNVDRFQRYIQDVMINKVTKGILAPAIGPWHTGMLVLPFELNQANTHFNEVIYQNIILSDVEGLLNVKASSLTQFTQAKLKAADGVVTGGLTLDPMANNFLTLMLHADQVQANAMAKALLNLPNQIFGKVTGDIRFTTSGQTEVENLNNTNGVATLRITEGRVPSLTRAEAMLTGANLLRTGVLGLSLNNISRILWPFEVNEFDKLSADMQFTNGKIYLMPGQLADGQVLHGLQTRNANLKLQVNGNIGLTDGYADMVVRGEMRQNVKGRFGRLGQWSVLYLLGHIPGINLGGRNLLGYVPGVGFIPGVGGPPNKGKTNFFTARMQGVFGDPKSVTNVTWEKTPDPKAKQMPAVQPKPVNPIMQPVNPAQQ
jgi:hypothetical protein